jgi:hypothetical protein
MRFLRAILEKIAAQIVPQSYRHHVIPTLPTDEPCKTSVNQLDGLPRVAKECLSAEGSAKDNQFD